MKIWIPPREAWVDDSWCVAGTLLTRACPQMPGSWLTGTIVSCAHCIQKCRGELVHKGVVTVAALQIGRCLQHIYFTSAHIKDLSTNQYRRRISYTLMRIVQLYRDVAGLQISDKQLKNAYSTSKMHIHCLRCLR